MIKKTRKFEGLNELPVYIEDETGLSPDFFDVTYLPKTLHAGKNLVRLKGNDANLKIGSAIYVEILDFNGDPIYYEIADFLYEDKSRIISIWIYEDTPPGEATLSIMGEVDQDLDGNPIPDEFRNIPNVRWKAYFTIDNSKRNDSEIIFANNNEPSLVLEEKIRPYLTRSYPAGQFVTQSVGTIDYTLSGENSQVTLTGNSFKPEHIGATIKITPNNAQPTLNINVDDSTYWAKIKSVLTTSSAVLDTKYYLEANDSNYSYTAKELTNCTYEIHYEASPVYNATQNLRSTAYLRINNIDPAVGEVYRTKTFIKSRGSSAAWELVDDTVLKESETQDILIDTGSIDIKTRMGEFTSNTHINTYWASTLKQRQNGTTVIDPPTYISPQQLTYDTGSYLLQSMYISSDTNTVYPQTYIEVRNNQRKEYEQAGQYDLTFNAVTRTSQTLGFGKKPYIEFYISGSAFATKTDSYGLGKKIGELDVAKLQPNAKGDRFRFENKKFTFDANEYGDGVLILKVNAGEWWFSDVSVTPSYELGFSPCQNAVVIALPTEHVNDELDFKVEYYDYQGQQSKYISYCDACEFEGGNVYIGGTKNLLTGSLFVGNGTGSGVEINGIVGGFVRSVGYTGFNNATDYTGAPGFAIWSGSGLANESGEDYNGVGLELHAGGDSGSLLFRTHPTPRFEVKTPAFFFGQPNGAFISGSNGNIQISSSYFQLSPEGQITASAGSIGGWEIASNKLYSEGGTGAGANKYVGMVTASSGTNIVFYAGSTVSQPADSSSLDDVKFRVRNNGQISASGVYVESRFPITTSPYYITAPMINTVTGITEGLNIGREIYNSYDQVIRYGDSQINPGTYVAQGSVFFMPGETNVMMSFTSKADFSSTISGSYGAATLITKRIKMYLRIIPLSLPTDHSTSVTYYDTWAASEIFEYASFEHSFLVSSPSAGSSYYTTHTLTIPSSTTGALGNTLSYYQGKLCRWQVYLRNYDKDTTIGNQYFDYLSATDIFYIRALNLRTGRTLGGDLSTKAASEARTSPIPPPAS